MIAATSIVYPGVKLGINVTIEDFCIIGAHFRGFANEETVIGDNALIRSHTVIYAGNRIGNDFQTGNKANIRELNTIGNNVSIGTMSVIEHHVQIEDNVRIHGQVFVPEYSVLRKDCWLGPNVTVTNARYPKSPNAKKELHGATIGRNAKIGAQVTILPGIMIGDNALVGAGSVVVHDVPENTIVAGNPARFLRNNFY